ncbi:MAG: FliM/FliN family flagellar motor C-terminal domain-containing protein [Terriglobales bacterium]|jgi:flagellar motor switch protein FliN/FliY|nr:FliM/FliN family flagellar motor C-terminal domain-containing protein [Terriglobales bacterium]
MASAQVAQVKPPEPQAQAQAKPQATVQGAGSPTEAYAWLRCKATAEIPVPRFTVGDLLNLRTGAVVQTASPVANDVPLRVNQTLVGWGRFEVVDDRLALRITELA